MAQPVYQHSGTPYGILLTIVEGLNTYELPEHNRAPVEVSFERIEQSRRTANGTRRRYFIADKRIINVSWTMLPNDSTQTAHAGIGAEQLEAMYLNSNNIGPVDLEIAKRDGGTETLSVHVVDFSSTIVKRYSDAHYYDVTMQFEEI